jgi:uncharacterized protein (DUF1778 family)
MATSTRGRITARVPPSVQETLELAAELVGATVNQFVVQVALREAEHVIEQERVIRLSKQDAETFLQALDNPPPPNDKLEAALRNYDEARRDDPTGGIDWSPRSNGV